MLAAGAGWPQGVVSNKAGAFLRREVTYLGWNRFFGPVVGAGDAVADKPAPAPLLLALQQDGTPRRSVQSGTSVTPLWTCRQQGPPGSLRS